MAGFYDVTNHQEERLVQYRRIESPSDAIGQAVYLEDAAEAALPAAVTELLYAGLVTYPGAVVNATVHVFPYDAAAGPLYISTQPANASPKLGANATFTVAASAGPASGTKTYKWYHDGDLITGATTATLTVAGATLNSEGQYWCVVSSTAAGKTESAESKHVTLNLAASVISTVGQIQYSADAVTWANTIPNGVLVVNTPVNFWVRANPDNLVDKDDGAYQYNYLMATVGAGGMSLRNQRVADGSVIAQISGITPEDQVGLTFSVNCTVKDSAGTEVAGTALSKAWA